jgi:hypothetical protein
MAWSPSCTTKTGLISYASRKARSIGNTSSSLSSTTRISSGLKNMLPAVSAIARKAGNGYLLRPAFRCSTRRLLLLTRKSVFEFLKLVTETGEVLLGFVHVIRDTAQIGGGGSAPQWRAILVPSHSEPYASESDTQKWYLCVESAAKYGMADYPTTKRVHPHWMHPLFY